MNVKALNQKEGFTIIEIVLAISIMAIIIVFMLNFFGTSTGFVHQTEIRSQALNIARIAMEELKARAENNWSNFLLTATTFDISDDIYSDLDFFTDDYILTVNLTQQDINGDDEYDENIRKIEITVSWGSNSISLESLITKR